jgi:SAM-dependent methyltransferase
VLGNDISPIQPSLVPPNVRFEVDDIEDQWVYSTKFDYIHSRYLMCSIRNWQKLMQQTYKFTKPGGWAEWQEFDTRFYTSTNGEYTKDNVIGQWADKLADGLRKFGVEPDPGPQVENWVKEVGFINVTAKTLPFPIGTWPKDKTLVRFAPLFILIHSEHITAATTIVFYH